MDKATLFRTVAFVSFVFDNCPDYHKRAESHFFSTFRWFTVIENKNNVLFF